ncbi:MAG: TetR/AcrR family transcriptional regulator [Roseiflexaceae bacterium]|nr:TetR/AcrR family transcriptional regulator [Roseiflexaceae bacterium]
MTTAETGDIRQRILDEATRLFVAQSYHGISMREIAEAVGVSKAGLYYHFRDKEELFLAILTNCLDRLEHGITQMQPTEPGTRAEVAAMLRAIFAQPPEQRAVMRLASNELAHLAPEARALFGKRYYEQFINRITTALRTGMERGELQQLEPHTATWILLGMAYPFFTPSEPREPAALEAIVDMILTIFFDGAAVGSQEPGVRSQNT